MQEKSSENMTSIEAVVFRRILVHVGGRHSSQHKHISVRTGWNGLGFLWCVVRCIVKWTPILDVKSVASKEAGN